MSDLTTSEVLDKAADLLEGNWGKGEWFNDKGRPVCLEGGIIAAMVPDAPDNEVYDAYGQCPAYQAVRAYLNQDSHVPLYEWNDADERTEEEVIAALRGAAQQEREKENSK